MIEKRRTSRNGRFFSSVIPFCCVPAAFLIVSSCLGTAPNESHLRVMFSVDVFSTVNRNDALASFRAWIGSIGTRRGLDLTVGSDTYNGPEELERLIQDGKGDLFIVDSMDYLSLEQEELPWRPYFLPERGNSVGRKYVVLTQGDQAQDLSALRGKRVLILKTKGVTLTRRWLESVLQEQELGDTETFFDSVEDVTKPSAAVLPVFFGQAEVCVVDHASFEVMTELNPQVGARLQVLLSSPPYVETVLCIHEHKVEHRQDLIEGLADLGNDPAGKQILMVFQIDGLVPFRDDLLDTVRTLRGGSTRSPEVTQVTP